MWKKVPSALLSASHEHSSIIFNCFSPSPDRRSSLTISSFVVKQSIIKVISRKQKQAAGADVCEKEEKLCSNISKLEKLFKLPYKVLIAALK
jgi:hypothetical protein